MILHISERRHAEEKTKLAYAELNQVFQTAADGMRVIDKDFNMLRINETFAALAGINKDEAKGKKCYEAFPSSHCHTQSCSLKRVFSGKDRIEFESLRERKDGTMVPCIVTATAFRGTDGELIGIVEDFKDITERKKLEESEFLEISSDFGYPREKKREAISNSFDAKATEIIISAVNDRSTGEDELVITISDNGEGMGEEELKFFFGLGFTNRLKLDEPGRKVTDAIGEKGHGTKIYFNSRRIEVETIRDTRCISAFLDNPKKNLRKGKLPEVKYEVTPTESPFGTKVIIRGYNDKNQAGFSHEELEDYICWFTRFGSFEKEIGIKKYEDVVIRLSGLGWKDISKSSVRHAFDKTVEKAKLEDFRFHDL